MLDLFTTLTKSWVTTNSSSWWISVTAEKSKYQTRAFCLFDMNEGDALSSGIMLHIIYIRCLQLSNVRYSFLHNLN